MSRKQGKQAISQEEITWINSANDKSAAAFITKFELNEKLSAHYHYRLLIESTNNISKTDRRHLNSIGGKITKGSSSGQIVEYISPQ